MIGWKSKNVLWYILIITIVQNGNTTKIRRFGKTIQKNQQPSEQNFFELSDYHNRKLDLKDITCKNNTTITANRCNTTTSCSTTISCPTTISCTTIKPSECVKTTTCNPDKQDDDGDDDDEDDHNDDQHNEEKTETEDKVKQSSYKPVWPKCQDAHSTTTSDTINCTQQLSTNAPNCTKCSPRMLTAVANNNIETTKSSIYHKSTKPSKLNKLSKVDVYEATLPPFLEHYITFGTFKGIICPLLKTHTKYVHNNNTNTNNNNNNNNNNNTSDQQPIIKKRKKKLIHSNNFRKNLLFSETLHQNVENKSETNNKNNWLHYLQERLQKGNSEYEDDKPTMIKPMMNLQEKWKNEQIKPKNHEDFMHYFLRNNLYNKNNQNLQSNNIHLYHPKNQEYSFEFNKIPKNNHQKSEKRNVYKEKKEDPVIPTSREETNKLNLYDKDYEDRDIETKKMAKLDHIFGNIIKDIAVNNENDLKSNNDSIKNNELQNDEDESLLYTKTTEQSVMNSYKTSNNEPNIQILNITQVFNMYSKLIPIKKYIEALQSNKLLATSEIEKNKNEFDKDKDKLLWLNESNENDLKQSIQYALIKELLKNVIRNSTDIDQFNNDNLYDLNALSSLHSINKNFNLNPFLLTLPMSKKSINRNKVKVPKIKKLNNDNDRIVNAIKDIIFKSIAMDNDENDDSLNIKKLKWNPSYETINQYA